MEMNQNFLSIGAGLLLGWLAVLGTPAEAGAQSLDELVDQAREYPDRVDRLKSQYLKPAILESEFTLETRFNNARVAYMLEDYDRASLLLADIVRSSDFEQFEGGRRTLYLLGDSLFQRRNFLSAKKYFQRVVERGQGEHYQDSIVRLLQIAARTGDYQGVSDLFDRFDDQREMGPSVLYMRGKTLYRQGESAKAVPFFSRAAESDEWEYRARYFKGVALADQGKYAEAKEVFEALSDEIDPDNAQKRKILHLSQLALGRVAYEQRNVEQAINYYQQLPRTSEYFDRALYELTWVLVSRGDYQAASRNADIFLYLSDPDPTFIPEVKLLKADLLLRTEKYEQASLAYQDVVDQFEPVKNRMEEFLKEDRNIEKFFRQLVDKEFQGDNPVYMPETVQQWIDRGQKLKEARRMVKDVARLQRDIERARRAIDQMRARMQSGSAIDSFPNLSQGMRVGIETDHQLVELRRKLLEREYELVKSEMSASEKERWKSMQSDFDDFQERYEAVPKTREAVRKRERAVQGRFEKLQEDLQSVQYMLEGQREQLQAVNKYISENYDGIEGLPKKKREKAKNLRSEVRTNIERLEKEQKRLKERIEVVRQKVGVGDQVTQKEREMRKEYREQIAKRREFLEQFHSRVGGSERTKLDKISEARRQIDPAQKELQTFFEKMRTIVDDKTAELRKKIEREEKLLDEREARLEKMMRRSKDEAAKAAINDYLRVRKKFDTIVMRGDVGLLDVVWQRKQDRTEELNQLRQNRRQELKQLQQSFEEVR